MAFSNPTDAFTSADLAAAIPEVWTPLVNEPKFAGAIASNFFTDLSPYANEGDTFHVPDIYTNTFTASTQSTQGNAVVDQSPAMVDVTLSVDTHKYVAWIIGDKDMKQLAAKYQLNARYARIAQKTLITALEASIFALWSSLSTNTVGDTATVLTDNEIVSSIEKLETANFDVMNEGGFFFHPFVYWRQIVTIAKYYTYNTSRIEVIRSGNFGEMNKERGLKGQIYGIPVYVSSNVVGALQTYRNILAVPEAFGFAIQSSGTPVDGMSGVARVRVQANYLLQNLGTLTVADIFYGVAVLREDAAVLINANTTAITS